MKENVHLHSETIKPITKENKSFASNSVYFLGDMHHSKSFQELYLVVHSRTSFFPVFEATVSTSCPWSCMGTKIKDALSYKTYFEISL